MNLTATTQVSSKTSLAPFVSLNHRDFRLLWTAQLISQAGSEMQLVTINWHIYLLTNSAVALGLIGLTRSVPIIVFSLIGGVFADTRNRRWMLFITQSGMMLCAMILGLLTNLGWISAILIYLLTAMDATGKAFDSPTFQSIVPTLVPKEHLTNALSLYISVRKIASVVGPGIAGFIIAWQGVAAVYWINAASYLAVLIAVMLMKTATQQNLRKARLSLSALWEGIGYVWHSQILLSTTLLDFFGTFFSSATALLPIFARDILRVGPQGLGILHAARAAGSIIAGTWMSFVGNFKKKGMLILWAIAIYAVATTLFGMSRWFALSVFFLGAVGAGDTVSMILRHTIRQLATPDILRGRMTSVITIFSNTGPQLGNLEAGLVAALIGAPLSVITGGIATLILIAVVAWRFPLLRNYEGC